MPEVSVLMPVYNTAKYVGEAIESILNQTFRDFEFIILDDGSTDGSLGIIRKYERQDSRIRVISRENRGLVKSRNELLHEARAELVAWADSDDVSYPERLEKQRACFADPEVVWVTAAMRFVDAKRRPIRVFSMADDPGFIGVCMLLREAAIQQGGFREGLHVCEDRDLSLRMREVGKTLVLPEVLLDYRQHSMSVCHSARRVMREYTEMVDRLAQERRERGSEVSTIAKAEDLRQCDAGELREPVASTYERWAWWALGAGNVATARKYAMKVFLRRPLSVSAWRLAYCAARGH